MKQCDEFSWMREVNSQSLQSSLRHLDLAYNSFFRKQASFPKFKSKYNKQSFTVPQFANIDNGLIKLPKFKNGIRMNMHRTVEGRLLFVTVSKSTTNRYYVSIACEAEHKSLPKTGSAVGIDTGIKNLATLSNGIVYENLKPLNSKLKKLKYNQILLSNKTKGSASKSKQRLKLAKIYEKVTNIRKDYLHKVTADIVKNHDIICIEDLSVKSMMQNYRIARHISDVALGEFYSMLKYKAEWNDRVIIKIDRFFPSSKMCGTCGYIKQDLMLRNRTWVCPSCSKSHDRDANASINILRQGLKILSGSGIESDIKQKRAEASPLGESMKPDNTTF